MVRVTAVLCAFFWTIYGLAAAQQPSAFDFLKPADFSSVEMSPNGRYFAAIQAKMEKHCVDKFDRMQKDKTDCAEARKKYRATYVILLYDLDESKMIKTLPLPDDFYATNLEWANNDRVLAAVRRRTTTNKNRTRVYFGSAGIFSIARGEGETVHLFGDTRVSKSNFRISSISNLLRNDPDHVLIPAYKRTDYDLWKVNVNTGDIEQVGAGAAGTFFWYTDNNGKPLLRYDSNARGTRIKVNAWSDDLGEWQTIKTFAIRRDEPESEFNFFPIGQAGEPHQIYVYSNEDNSERATVKIYDLKEEKYIETVFSHEKYDVANTIIDLETGAYAGAVYYDDRRQASYLNKKSQAHFNGLNQFFGNASNVRILGFNATGDRAMLHVSAPDNPGEYYIYDIKNTAVTPLLSNRPGLSKIPLGGGEILTLPTRDDVEITAYLTHPAGGKNPDSPLIVIPHGGPEVRDYFDYNHEAQFLATRGYQVLQVNFRGSSGYGRAFAEAGYGEWGGVMQNDVTDAVRYLNDNGIARAGNACIVGYSYGGYAALYGAASTPALYKCVVSGGGVSDLLADLSFTREVYGAASESYQYWLKSMGNPIDDRELLSVRSPIKNADKIKQPVLLFHGEYDSIVSVEQSRRMQSALKRADGNVTYIEFENEGHGHNGWEMETRIRYLTEIENFLAKHLPQ